MFNDIEALQTLQPERIPNSLIRNGAEIITNGYWRRSGFGFHRYLDSVSQWILDNNALFRISNYFRIKVD